MGNKVELLRSAYDFITNNDGELMLVMEALEHEADEENVRFVYDRSSATAALFRNSDQIVEFPFIAEEYRDMLDEIEIILVTEMDGDEISDVYEVRVDKCHLQR